MRILFIFILKKISYIFLIFHFFESAYKIVIHQKKILNIFNLCSKKIFPKRNFNYFIGIL